jgi:transcriptional regulator with XRE-family HTH domain
MTLGARLRQERKQNEWTVAGVCERLAMSTSNYIRIEGGGNVPLRKGTLKNLSRVFQLPYDTLVNYAISAKYRTLMDGEKGGVEKVDRDDYTGSDAFVSNEGLVD